MSADPGLPGQRLVPDFDASPLTRRDLARALLFLAASLAVYLTLGQRILYGDGPEFMLLLHHGAASHKNHLAYIPLLRASSALGTPLGLSAFESARLLSQFGVAVGVGVFYLVSRRFGLAPRRAALVTLLIASTPSVIFFATVVEVHAPYFALLALAWLAAAQLAHTPTLAFGALLGGACSLAYLGHASGLVLPAPLLLVAAHAARSPRRLLRPALACTIVHAVAVTLGPWALSHAGHTASPAGAIRFVAWWQMEVFERPAAALLVLLDEWLLAYLPVSLLWLRAVGQAPRSAGVAFLALLPYLLLSVAFLAVYREFGAYHQAVVWLFAWLVVRSWREPVLWLAVAVGLATGFAKVVATDDRARLAAYATGLDQVTGASPPLLLIGDHADYEHCFITQPRVAFVNLAAPCYAEPDLVEDAIRGLDARIAAHRDGGGRSFLTAGGYDLIARIAAQSATSGFAKLLQHLQTRHRHAIVGAHGFRAVELTPAN